MKLPFTVDQFLGVFAAYNGAVWPMQLVLNALALAVIILAVRPFAQSGRTILLTLAGLWLWTGIVYHIAFFAAINPAARFFGAAFVLQGLLFGLAALRRPPAFRAGSGWRELTGWAFVAYALVVYPLIGYAAGHGYPHGPSFGAPCPATIFTFGVLLWADRPPRHLLAIPALWSLLGFTAALTLGIREDVGLLVAGVAGTAIMLVPRRQNA